MKFCGTKRTRLDRIESKLHVLLFLTNEVLQQIVQGGGDTVSQDVLDRVKALQAEVAAHTGPLHGAVEESKAT